MNLPTESVGSTARLPEQSDAYAAASGEDARSTFTSGSRGAG